MQEPHDIHIAPARRDADRVCYQLNFPGRSYDVYFSSSRVELAGTAEAALALVALGAMRTGSAVICDTPLSITFVRNQQRLSEIFTGWFPEFSSLLVRAPEQKVAASHNTGRVGCFFTGGVDSFYSFLQHRDEITDLIYVHGYDIKLDDLQHRRAVSEMGAAIERDTGVRFIEIETDAIRVFKDFGKWGLHGHGYGLGVVARLLEGYLDRIYIPSSFSQSEQLPWASHPDTDPLFTDEALQVIHDDCSVGRTDKICFLSSHELALRHLRVCWKNVAGAYNCGTCEKCLRTMTSLYGMGVLERSVTFPQGIDVRAIRHLVVDADSSRRFVADNIAFLHGRGLGQSDVARAWQTVLDRPAWRNRVINRVRRLRKQWQRAIGKLDRG